jgi:hypothetical protein
MNYFEYLYKKFAPSFYVKNDPLENIQKFDNRFRLLNLSSLRLTSSMANKILEKRKNRQIQLKRFDGLISIIVPYRNRAEHLSKFIPYMKEYLSKDNIQYEIIIVEQLDHLSFNRAKLINIGATLTSQNSQMIVSHDVDTLPQNIDYRPINFPLRPFGSIRENEPNIKDNIFGAVNFIPKEIFFQANGFSNNYWHWGSEDDDFLMRLLLIGAVPFVDDLGQYFSLPHEKSVIQTSDGIYQKDEKIVKELLAKRKTNKNIFSNMKRGLLDPTKDGLNSLEYELIEILDMIDYKLIRVKL